MKKFHFKAIKHTGETIQGVIASESELTVAKFIHEHEMRIVKITAENTDNRWFNFHNKINLYDIAVFCRQISTLIGSGISLITALNILHDQTEKKNFQNIIMDVANRVQQGLPLSKSMSVTSAVFPSQMISMLEAGETSGDLEGTFLRLADQFESEYRLMEKLKSAMVYPAVVILMAIIVVTILLAFVMPVFVELFQSLNVVLPWPTKMVLYLSGFVGSWKFLVLLVLLGAGGTYLMKKIRSNDVKFKIAMDKLIMKVPVFGDLYKKIIITRFATTFAGLSKSGVPILVSIDVVAKATGSALAAEVLHMAKSNVRMGKGLSEPMEKSGLFPPMVVNMVSIGEETGTLDYMLIKIAEFYTNEVNDKMGRLQTLLEPFLIAILGVIVGFIAIAMLLPMFEIITKVGGA